MRLARAIALAGIASRRKAEEMIRAGVVSVNGKPVGQVATAVDPEKDEIRVNGERLRSERKTYLLLNKPRGVISTASDPEGRKTVLEYVPPKLRSRLYPVGRLDRESSGLMLLTNDGDLAFRLMHPKFHVAKRYFVKLDRPLSEENRIKLERGVFIEGGRTAPCKIRTQRGSLHAEVEIFEGRKRQIRQMFYRRGYDVKRLERMSMGPLTLKGLRPGAVRLLGNPEISRLKKAVGLEV